MTRPIFYSVISFNIFGYRYCRVCRVDMKVRSRKKSICKDRYMRVRALASRNPYILVNPLGYFVKKKTCY